MWIYHVGFQIIAKQLNFKWKDMTVLAVLQKSLGNTLDQMIKLVHQNLHVEVYSKKEVRKLEFYNILVSANNIVSGV